MAHWQAVDELHDISADLPRFTKALTELATRLGLEIAPLDADHISLRCHQNATAERWRAGLEKCGTLLSENIINGRPICLFKLDEPVCVEHWRFTVVELPWPGEKRYPHEGWEHVEIVLPGEPATLNARALDLLSDAGLRETGISVKTSSPKGDRERLPNPTLAVTDGKVTIKFHPWSIEQIVASEQGGLISAFAPRFAGG
ncbi:VOC family protein [Klebsiella sp. Ap-873]|nr:VOC family protein [Klebsiella sp. Ap-873]